MGASELMIVMSRVRSSVLAVALACGTLASSGAFAQEEPVSGDPERGATLAYTCLGCHGIPGYKNTYPAYHVPKLAGQHPEYLVTALQAYKSGERSHMTMHSQASSLSDQDMADIAAYFANYGGQPVESGGEPKGGAPESAQLCVTCHGEDGVGITPQYPTLAGQHADYLARALQEYKRGGRKNPIMSGFAATLTNEQIRELAEYYSRQKPSLRTIEPPYKAVAAAR